MSSGITREQGIAYANERIAELKGDEILAAGLVFGDLARSGLAFHPFWAGYMDRFIEYVDEHTVKPTSQDAQQLFDVTIDELAKGTFDGVIDYAQDRFKPRRWRP